MGSEKSLVELLFAAEADTPRPLIEIFKEQTLSGPPSREGTTTWTLHRPRYYLLRGGFSWPNHFVLTGSGLRQGHRNSPLERGASSTFYKSLEEAGCVAPESALGYRARKG